MHPILFHIGRYGVHTYGVVLMVAFVVGIGRAYRSIRQNPRAGIRPDDVLDVGIWMVIAGIIGARVAFVVVEWAAYKNDPKSMFEIWNGGVSFHGSFFGALLALIVFCVRRRVAFLRMADVMAPSAMLGYAIGRLGCFFNGCCYGAPTSLPWGIRFLDDGRWTPPSHPTQLYATALSLVFFAVLVWVERRRRFDGQVLCWYVLFSGTERFIMEIWRANVTSTVVALGLTDVQWLCLGMVLVAAVGLLMLRRRAMRPAAGSGTPLVEALPR